MYVKSQSMANIVLLGFLHEHSGRSNYSSSHDWQGLCKHDRLGLVNVARYCNSCQYIMNMGAIASVKS